MKKLILLLLFLDQPFVGVVANEEPDFEKLAAIAKRYACPQPKDSDKLVFVWNGGVSSYGPRNSKQSGTYVPGFIVADPSKKKSVRLLGFRKKELFKRPGVPVTRGLVLSRRPYSDRDGYSVLFSHVSNFETCIQMARRGNAAQAKKLWKWFSNSERFEGVHVHEDMKAFIAKPEMLLGRSIFEYYKAKIAEEKSDTKFVLDMLLKLRKEFPELFSEQIDFYHEYYRNRFVEDLRKTLDVPPPMSGTVEAWLVEWGNNSSEQRQRRIYDSYEAELAIPARKILDAGVDSIPELVLLTNDPRLTRRIRAPVHKSLAYQLRVGDLARQLLREIAGSKSPVMSQWKERPGIWKEWIKTTDLSNEAEFLFSAAFDATSGRTFEAPIHVLEKRHPAVFLKLVDKISRDATASTNCFDLTDAIRSSKKLSNAEKSQLLVRFFSQVPSRHKRASLQVLAALDSKAASKLAIPWIKKLPRDVDEPYWTCEAANVTHVVKKLNDTEVWKVYLAAAKKASVGLRMEMMEPLNYSFVSAKNKELRLAVLAAFLDDQTIRIQESEPEKFEGPCAAFTFEKIKVQDFVAMKIASMIMRDEERPNDDWTPTQWDSLRAKVKKKIQALELPKLNSK